MKKQESKQRISLRLSAADLDMLDEVAKLGTPPYRGMNRTQLIEYAIREKYSPILAQGDKGKAAS